MKKRFAFILIAVMAIVMAAGCSSGNSKTADQTNPPAAETTIGNSTANNNNTNEKLIGEDKAKKTALDKVKGAAEADITEFHLDEDHGRKEYDGEIRYNGKEYDFEIDAVTGDIVSWEEEKHQ